MRKEFADHLMASQGWLAAQPEEFRRDVLARAVILPFEPGEFVYRRGDPLGGVYGLITGVVSIGTAPADELSRLVHIGTPGTWTGEGCFLSRQPRRVDLIARSRTFLMHLPLNVMDRMAESQPAVTRSFAQILMATAEVFMRIVHDLQIPHTERRIASILHRIASPEGHSIPLTQAEVGMMANASRKQVNAAFQRFSQKGWIDYSYRMIIVLDDGALGEFARGETE